MADLSDRVRAALGPAYDSKAEYLVVRPTMTGLPKYAGCQVVGEFDEDTRNGTKLVILLRSRAAVPPPFVSRPGVAERVRSIADSVLRRGREK